MSEGLQQSCMPRSGAQALHPSPCSTLYARLLPQAVQPSKPRCLRPELLGAHSSLCSADPRRIGLSVGLGNLPPLKVILSSLDRRARAASGSPWHLPLFVAVAASAPATGGRPCLARSTASSSIALLAFDFGALRERFASRGSSEPAPGLAWQAWQVLPSPISPTRLPRGRISWEARGPWCVERGGKGSRCFRALRWCESGGPGGSATRRTFPSRWTQAAKSADAAGLQSLEIPPRPADPDLRSISWTAQSAEQDKLRNPLRSLGELAGSRDREVREACHLLFCACPALSRLERLHPAIALASRGRLTSCRQRMRPEQTLSTARFRRRALACASATPEVLAPPVRIGQTKSLTFCPRRCQTTKPASDVVLPPRQGAPRVERLAEEAHGIVHHGGRDIASLQDPERGQDLHPPDWALQPPLAPHGVGPCQARTVLPPKRRDNAPALQRDVGPSVELVLSQGTTRFYHLLRFRRIGREGAQRCSGIRQPPVAPLLLASLPGVLSYQPIALKRPEDALESKLRKQGAEQLELEVGSVPLRGQNRAALPPVVLHPVGHGVGLPGRERRERHLEPPLRRSVKEAEIRPEGQAAGVESTPTHVSPRFP
eukprot:scaffold1070_cov245-Pinguiococcus_pyrenoidosus.AAC.37